MKMKTLEDLCEEFVVGRLKTVLEDRKHRVSFFLKRAVLSGLPLFDHLRFVFLIYTIFNMTIFGRW